jgi:copper transport protein
MALREEKEKEDGAKETPQVSRSLLSSPRRRPWLTLLLAFAVYTVGNSSPADSHANQLKSSPPPDSELETSPDRVVVWFSEEIEASLSEVRVIDANARQVDNGDSAISPTQPTALIVTLPPLENGTYTVVWKNLSTVDGHRLPVSFSQCQPHRTLAGPLSRRC